ncbi:MAG: spore germination protein, partial [Bacteroidetes bacterium]
MPFRHLFNKKPDREKTRINQEKSSNSDKIFLSLNLNENLQQIRQNVGNSPDVVIREFEIGSSQIQIAAVYTSGLADKNMVSDFVMRSLMIDTVDVTFQNGVSEENIFDFIKDNALTVGEVKVIKDWNGLILSVLSGDTLILMNGWSKAISCGTRGGEKRSVSEPTSQVVIRGPKDGFSESIGTNISLVRRRIKSPNLWLEPMKIGD